MYQFDKNLIIVNTIFESSCTSENVCGGVTDLNPGHPPTVVWGYDVKVIVCKSGCVTED